MSKSNIIGMVSIIIAVIGIIVPILVSQNSSPSNIQDSKGDNSPPINTQGNVTINYNGVNNTNTKEQENIAKENSSFFIELKNPKPECTIDDKLAREILIGEDYYNKSEYQQCINYMRQIFGDAKGFCENAAINLIIGSCHYKNNDMPEAQFFLGKAKRFYEIIHYEKKEYGLALKTLNDINKNTAR